MIEKISKKLGNTTEIIGYILTYGTMVVIYLGVYLQLENESFKHTLGLVFSGILVFIFIHFIGRILYTFYSSYLKHDNQEISLQKFKIQWYSSLIIITALWSLFLFLLVGFVISVEDSNESWLLSLIFIPLIVPQTILQYKTVDLIRFPFSIKSKVLKMVNSLKLDKLERNEIIIISLIIGVVLSLLFGYKFCNIHYYKWSKGNLIEVYSKTKQKNCTFNYAIATGVFIIVSGLTYLFLNKRSTMNY